MKYTSDDVQVVFEVNGTKHIVDDWVDSKDLDFRAEVIAKPNTISIEEAFAICFERYKDAFMEMAQTTLVPDKDDQ